MRPFMGSAKVVPRGCSRPLQRAITDFAADQPFALARLKLREHYGFEIGESTMQRITLGHARSLHAQALFAVGQASQDFPETPGRHREIVAQTDGGMIPIVEPDKSRKDKRKGKSCRGERPSFASHTPREAKRRSTPPPSRAASKPPGGSFSPARCGPASAPALTFTPSATERPGSSARSNSSLARRAAT